MLILRKLRGILWDALLCSRMLLREGGGVDRVSENNMRNDSMTSDYCQGLLLVSIIRMRRAEVEWMEEVGAEFASLVRRFGEGETWKRSPRPRRAGLIKLIHLYG